MTSVQLLKYQIRTFFILGGKKKKEKLTTNSSKYLEKHVLTLIDTDMIGIVYDTENSGLSFSEFP